jgi:hypothetical protein
MRHSAVAHPNNIKEVKQLREQTLDAFFLPRDKLPQNDKPCLPPKPESAVNLKYYTIVDVPGDGNCLYHAVISSFNEDKAEKVMNNHIALRQDLWSLFYLILFKPKLVDELLDTDSNSMPLIYTAGRVSSIVFNIAKDVFRHNPSQSSTKNPPTHLSFFNWLEYDPKELLRSYLSSPLTVKIIEGFYECFGIPSPIPDLLKNKEIFNCIDGKPCSDEKTMRDFKKLQESFVGLASAIILHITRDHKPGAFCDLVPFGYVVAKGLNVNIHYALKNSYKPGEPAQWACESAIMRPEPTSHSPKHFSPPSKTILLYKDISISHFKSIHHRDTRTALDEPPPRDYTEWLFGSDQQSKVNSPSRDSSVRKITRDNLVIRDKIMLDKEHAQPLEKYPNKLNTMVKCSFVDVDSDITMEPGDIIGVDHNNWEYVFPSESIDTLIPKHKRIHLLDPIHLYVHDMKNGLRGTIGAFLYSTQSRITFDDSEIPSESTSASTSHPVSTLRWRVVHNPIHSVIAPSIGLNGASLPVLVNGLFVFDLKNVVAPFPLKPNNSNGQSIKEASLYESGLHTDYIYSLANTNEFIQNHQEFELSIFQYDTQEKTLDLIGFKKLNEPQPCNFVTIAGSTPRFIILSLKNYNLHEIKKSSPFIDPSAILTEETKLMTKLLESVAL